MSCPATSPHDVVSRLGPEDRNDAARNCDAANRVSASVVVERRAGAFRDRDRAAARRNDLDRRIKRPVRCTGAVLKRDRIVAAIVVMVDMVGRVVAGRVVVVRAVNVDVLTRSREAAGNADEVIIASVIREHQPVRT